MGNFILRKLTDSFAWRSCIGQIEYRFVVSVLILLLTVVWAKAQTIQDISFKPSVVMSGQSSTGTVTLDQPAPDAGWPVNLTNSFPQGASVPSSITIPSGSLSASFSVSTLPYSRTLAYAITANDAKTAKTATLTALGDGVRSLTLDPSYLASGQSSTATLILLSNAPNGGWQVNLTSSLPAYCSVPSFVTVPAGSNSTTFTVNTVEHTRFLSTTITASDPTTKVSSKLYAYPQAITAVTINPTSLIGGNSSRGIVMLADAAPAGGWTVNLASSLPGYASVPSSIIIPPNQLFATFPISTVAHSRDLTFTITASDYASKQFATLTTLADSVKTLTVTPTGVLGGAKSTGTVTLTVPAPAGGWKVNLASSLSAYASVPASIIVPAGTTQARFEIDTVAYSRALTFTITARDDYSFQSVKFSTAPIGILNLSVAPNTVIGKQPASGTVTLTASAPDGGWPVSLSTSTPSLASVPSSITIPAGETTGTFRISTSDYTRTLVLVITAKDIATSQTATLTVVPPVSHGLANSAWPKLGGNLLNTGLGKGSGATGSLKWEFGVGNTYSSPVIGSDGTVYVGGDVGLEAFSPAGILKWQYPGAGGQGFALGSDGAIYTGTDNGVFAINADGSLRWFFHAGGGTQGAPTIAMDGTVYIGCYGSSTADNYSGLIAINPSGTLKWRTSIGEVIESSPLLGPDGTIYVGTNGYSSGNFYAVNPNGSIKWIYPAPLYRSAAMDKNGVLYVCSSGYESSAGVVYAINSDGTQKWHYPVGGNLDTSPAIGPDGTIYVASQTGLCSFTPAGILKWKTNNTGYGDVSPCVASDGTIYISYHCGPGQYTYGLYAFDPDGSQKWLFPTKFGIDSTPAIDLDGTLYFTGDDGSFYAIK